MHLRPLFVMAAALGAAGGGDDAAAIDATVADAAVDAVTIDALIDAPPNLPPSVTAITGPAALLAGDGGTFAATATDPEGDSLTYAWTAAGTPGPGTFAASTAASTGWYSGAVGAAGTATLTLSVSDGVNPPVTQTFAVAVTVPHLTDVQPIFTATCTACHGNQAGLHLEDGMAYASLVNVTASNAACNTLARVTPGDPDSSVLYRKITGTTCGTRMPASNPLYFDDNPGLVIRVRSWILGGALP